MKTPPHSRTDILIHELNHSGVSNAAITLANAMVENGLHTRLIVIGDETPPPFPLHKNLELKFLEIERGKNFFGKILYFIRSYFVLSVYLAKERSRRLFVWGKEFTIMAEIIRITLMLQYKLVGVNVTSISSHLQHSLHPFPRKILNFVYKSLLENPDHIIAQSSGMVKELHSVYNVPENKITVIAPPLQLKFFQNPAHGSRHNQIVFIGKLSESKDPLTALEIFNKLENKTAAMQFIGEGELEENLRDKVRELGLEGRVSFAGRQDDILPFLRRADVLIMTSQYEGFGMVLAESIACGVPVVSFDCPSGPSEIIIDSVNGYLIPPGDVELFTKKLNQALINDWDHNKISETANKFHSDVVIKQYLDIIKKHLT